MNKFSKIVLFPLLFSLFLLFELVFGLQNFNATMFYAQLVFIFAFLAGIIYILYCFSNNRLKTYKVLRAYFLLIILDSLIFIKVMGILNSLVLVLVSLLGLIYIYYNFDLNEFKHLRNIIVSHKKNKRELIDKEFNTEEELKVGTYGKNSKVSKKTKPKLETKKVDNSKKTSTKKASSSNKTNVSNKKETPKKTNINVKKAVSNKKETKVKTQAKPKSSNKSKASKKSVTKRTTKKN